jgi:hypothetical protein
VTTLKSLDAETLIEREKIRDILVGYWCTGTDTVNWKMYRSVFADDFEGQLPNLSPPGSPPPEPLNADEWMNLARQVEGFDATQHVVSNLVYDISGDTAVVTAYLVAEHHLSGESFVLGGQSAHTLSRTPEGWKVTKVSINPWWTRSEAGLMAKAAERYASGLAPRSALAVV